MFVRAELKSEAKRQIKGNIGILFVCTLIIGLIVSIPSGTIFPLQANTNNLALHSLSSLIAIFLAPAFFMGIVMIYLNLTKGQKPAVGDIFKGFHIYGKAVWLFVITQFFTMLWSLLFIVPGIIKSIAYSMSPYILAENPDMTAREALNESKRITAGHKGELFVLSLSFFGWILLGCITFGIAMIYVAPYMQATMTNAYLNLKEQAQNPIAEKS